ncbi:MAG: radical SAM protein [Eubacteriales bacterium]|nr:radical SAM protein [Eubacteriales bacterium]
MRILLIRPPRIKQAITLSDMMFSEPLGLEMLSALLKDNHEVEIFDMMCDRDTLEAKLEEFKADVAGVTSLCIDVKEVLRLTKRIKSYDSDVITIVGGTQAYVNPKAFMDDSVDHIFKTTTKDNITGFFVEIQQAKNESKSISEIKGIISRNYGQTINSDEGRNEYILPDRESTAKYREHYSYFGYKPAAIMQISQGCDKMCRFCLRWRIEGHEAVEFETELIEADLLNIKESTIMLYDNDIFGSSNRVERFIRILVRNGIEKNFIAYASVDSILNNTEALKDFKAHGLKALIVGYESFSEEDLKYYTKKASVDDNLNASILMKSLGIDVWASFMAHPDWTKDDFRALRKYVKKLSPQVSSVSPLTPFPNLPLYKEYEERLLYQMEDYEKWSFAQVMIRPNKMSLKSYYMEMLKTNLYINLFINKPTEMLDRYGLWNILRLVKGSLCTMIKYLRLSRYGAK